MDPRYRAQCGDGALGKGGEVTRSTPEQGSAAWRAFCSAAVQRGLWATSEVPARGLARWAYPLLIGEGPRGQGLLTGALGA